MLSLSVKWKSKFARLAVLLLFGVLIGELLAPAPSLAISGGPHQPEMAGFTPKDNNNFVDLFSGDFHFSIPIMTVPGPNGGYPITLNYHAAVGMEQDASWVGLGWNLNPGAINRQVRGLPDDFNGEEIVKTYKRRDNKTYIFTPSGSVEYFGADFGIGGRGGTSFIYNTFNGLSLSQHFGLAAAHVRNGNIKSERSKLSTANLGVTFDSEQGITPSFSINVGNEKLRAAFHAGLNSKSGVFSFSSALNFGSFGKHSQLTQIGTSFSTAAEFPPINIPLTSRTFGTAFQAGGSSNYVEGFGSVATSVCIQTTPDEPVRAPAYGLCYAHNGQTEPHAVQDFNREKELHVNEQSLNLPLPVMTHDLYHVTGEQLVGSFRIFRNDYGHFFDNYVKNTTNTVNTGVDFSGGNCAQIGANLSVNHNFSISSDWDGDFSDKFRFRDKKQFATLSNNGVQKQLYEPFYFQMSAELAAQPLDYLQDVGGEAAVSFPLDEHFAHTDFGVLHAQYLISDKLKPLHGSTFTVQNAARANRAKRSCSIEYETGNSSQAHRRANHISAFSIVNADGLRYTFGKTLYNIVDKEVYFSVPYHNDVTSSITKHYSRGNATGTERIGKEQLYSCTELPPYPYAYLLTEITAPDYVDANQNGTPDEADFGFWVKFHYYTLHSSDNYHWRVPYEGAHHFSGDRSDQTDDIGSYRYGEREFAYLYQIETKTHMAQFYTSTRHDGMGVRAENEWCGGWDGWNNLPRRLDSIQLFSKEDLTHPIQTAIFKYGTELCLLTPNSWGGTNGKLTLHEVYIKYENSKKGAQNSYQFNYSAVNPTYHEAKIDRWGNYNENGRHYDHYVLQDSARINSWASAWLLTGITFPEGGSMAIEYESDDYAYVQNRQATAMTKMTGVNNFEKLNGDYIVTFDKKSGVPIVEYVKNFDNNLLFFKIANRFQAGNAPDYIQGYVEIDIPKTLAANADSSKQGILVLKPFSVADVHPIFLHCCQHLKNQRPDLLFGNIETRENPNDATAFFRALVSEGVISEFLAMFGNRPFYHFCDEKSYYKNAVFNDRWMPSYLRLNVPNKVKYGGGARVRAITYRDNWTKSAPSDYRKEYFYRTEENGKIISSGVAEYEPIVGAEENALRYPVYDKVRGNFFVEDETYSETPYGEHYFPAANVGYSQVIVKTSTPENVNKSAAGIQTFEFYTAKDFPIITEQTPLQCKRGLLPNLLNMLTVGFKQVSTTAFSQGYKIALNDMHGKAKAASTFPFQPTSSVADLVRKVAATGYTSRVEYHYFEEERGGVRQLNNRVDVLTAEGKTAPAILGQKSDFVIDQRENFSKSTGTGVAAQFMLGNCTPPLPGVSAMPQFDCFEERIRAVTTTKIIYKNGILKRTIAYNNGAKITTDNILFDPYTGQPLLTSTTNEFEQPVYSYAQPAYWFYKNMGSAADNYRAIFNKNWNDNDSTIFAKYDKIQLNNALFTLKSANSYLFRFWDNNDNEQTHLLNNDEFVEIMQSRKSNQLNAVAATQKSLTNPITARRYPLFEAFNAQTDSCFEYQTCGGETKLAKIGYYNHKYYFFGDIIDKYCEIPIRTLLNVSSIPYVVSEATEGLNVPISQVYFTKQGERVLVSRRDATASESISWNDENELFPECFDGILQAAAVEFSNDWRYPYVDVGAPAAISENFLRLPNIYRTKRANVFDTERKQTGYHPDYQTNTAWDGTFNFFNNMNFKHGNATHAQYPWTWTTEITKFSPYGFEIENRNALNVYESALYGYDNQLATAVAHNAQYREIAFDGFENDLPFSTSAARGHFLYIYNNRRTPRPICSSEHAHTGRNSLCINALTFQVQYTENIAADTNWNGIIMLERGKKYYFSCWVRKADCATIENIGNNYYYKIDDGNFVAIPPTQKIDCWQRLEFAFTVPEFSFENSAIITIQDEDATPTPLRYYFDDLRLLPYDATMKTYVYTPENYRLVAEMDDNNCATFYNYDEEGVVVQIKKETEDGIRTIKTLRQNLKKNR